MKSNDAATIKSARPTTLHAVTIGSDRRKHRRVSPRVMSALLDDGEQRNAVTVEDISISGARIANAPPEFGLGDSLRIAAQLPGSDVVRVRCTVVHVTGNDAHTELGVKFEGVANADTQALQEYIAARLATDTEHEEPAAA